MRNVVTSPILFPDPENVGVAVGISLLLSIEAEIMFLTYFRLMAAIFISPRDTMIKPVVEQTYQVTRISRVSPAFHGFHLVEFSENGYLTLSIFKRLITPIFSLLVGSLR